MMLVLSGTPSLRAHLVGWRETEHGRVTWRIQKNDVPEEKHFPPQTINLLHVLVYSYFLPSPRGGPPDSAKGPGRQNRRNASGGPGRGGAGRGRGRGRFGDDEGRGGRGVSLRVGTGKKGRQTEIRQRRGSLKRKDRSLEKALKEERALERRTVRLTGSPMTVGELAEAIGETPVSVIKFLMTDLGVMAAVSQSLDPPTCEAVAEGFGKVVAGEDDDEWDDEDEEE